MYNHHIFMIQIFTRTLLDNRTRRICPGAQQHGNSSCWYCRVLLSCRCLRLTIPEWPYRTRGIPSTALRCLLGCCCWVISSRSMCVEGGMFMCVEGGMFDHGETGLVTANRSPLFHTTICKFALLTQRATFALDRALVVSEGRNGCQ